MAKLEPLFGELDKAIQAEEFESALEITEKVLKQSPEDLDAFQCKVVCLIQLNEFQNCIDAITNSKHAAALIFEQAYCLYRLKRHTEALNFLKGADAPKTVRMLQLEAQLRYGAEDYAGSARVYEELEKSHKVESTELKTNLCAALCMSDPSQGIQLATSNKETLHAMFEFTYNAATSAINSGDMEKALELLKLAEDVGRKSMSDLEDDEIEDEISVVLVQKAYVIQQMGQTQEAQDLLQPLLKRRSSNDAAWAIGCNNMASMRGEHNLFDSEKLLKRAVNEKVLDKLTSVQRRTILANQAVVLLAMNKVDQCREQVELLRKQFPESPIPTLILASLLFRSKKSSQCEELLKNEIERQGDKVAVEIPLSLAQMYLNKTETARAIEVLGNILLSGGENKGYATVVASLVRLASNLRDSSTALRVFHSIENDNHSLDASRISLFNAIAQFKMQRRLYSDAARIYSRIFDANPKDIEPLCNLIIACSYVDLEQTEKFARRLPPLGKGIEKLDAAELEKAVTSSLAPRVTSTSSPTPSSTATVSSTSITARRVRKGDKKKKKRKPRLPKKYDPSVAPDPERWLPRRERSYYKRRGKKNQISRGSQGSAATSAQESELNKGAKGTQTTPPVAGKKVAGAPPAAPSGGRGRGGKRKGRR